MVKPSKLTEKPMSSSSIALVCASAGVAGPSGDLSSFSRVSSDFGSSEMVEDWRKPDPFGRRADASNDVEESLETKDREELRGE